MVKLIVYIVIILLVLSFFGISLERLIDSPTTQGNFSFLGDQLEKGWNILVDLISQTWHSLGF